MKEEFLIMGRKGLRSWVESWISKYIIVEIPNKKEHIERTVKEILGMKDCPLYIVSDWGPFLERLDMMAIFHKVKPPENWELENPAKLTDKEKSVLQNLAQAWNEFLELPVQHEDDVDEFRLHIHALENAIACRLVGRIHPEMYSNNRKDSK